MAHLECVAQRIETTMQLQLFLRIVAEFCEHLVPHPRYYRRHRHFGPVPVDVVVDYLERYYYEIDETS